MQIFRYFIEGEGGKLAILRIVMNHQTVDFRKQLTVSLLY